MLVVAQVNLLVPGFDSPAGVHKSPHRYGDVGYKREPTPQVGQTLG